MNFWRGVTRSVEPQWQAIRRQAGSKNIVTAELPKNTHTFPVKRTGFAPGDKSPFAHNDTYQYPADFKPWTYNYKGNGVLGAFFACAVFSFVAYERAYLNKTGRFERKTPSTLYKV